MALVLFFINTTLDQISGKNEYTSNIIISVVVALIGTFSYLFAPRLEC